MLGQSGAGQRGSFKAKLQLHSNILIFTLHPHRAAAEEMQRNEFVYRNVFHNSALVCLQNIKRDGDTSLSFYPLSVQKLVQFYFCLQELFSLKKESLRPTLSSSLQLMFASHSELETKDTSP